MAETDPLPRRRSGAFARSDIHNAAEEFVATVSEHAEEPWDNSRKAMLAESLTDQAFRVVRGWNASFA